MPDTTHRFGLSRARDVPHRIVQSPRREVAVHTAKSFCRQTLLRAARVCAAAAGLSSAASAQVVRGVVVDEGSGRGLPGVVVVLLDSAGNRLAGVLAGDDGRYAIRTTAPGRYAVRAERIGYRADAPTSIALSAGQTVELELVTRPVPVVLSEVRVTEKSACVTGAADGRDVSAVWEETRKALFATDLTQQQELFSARVSRFVRTLDARSGRVTGYQVREANSVTRSPFVSQSAAWLSANGYAKVGPTETLYYAPDASVLLSDEFLRDHCFRLRDGEGKRKGLIGLAFEPVKGRELPDIAGTLWIDRKSAELRDLEYMYSELPSLPRSVKSDDFGGRIEFHRMPTGAWIVERWVIRMPLLVDKGALARDPVVVPGMAPSRPERIQLAGIHEEGGEVLETVARGARRELSTEVATVRGTVYDSTRMAPLVGARVFLDGTQFAAKSATDGSFLIEKVPPGTYAISVVHARFDSLDVPAPSVDIAVAPNEEHMAHLAGPSVATVVARDCRDDERSEGTATLRGHVRDGFTSGPAVDAQVTLVWRRLQTSEHAPPVMERSLSTRTDSAGRYRFCGLPDGVKLTARVVTGDRRSASADMVLSDRDVPVVDLVIGKPTVVAAGSQAAAPPAVVVVSSPGNRVMQEFERRRRRGNGSYLTRVQIERMHAERLTDLLRTMPGVSVEMGDHGALVVELRRSKSFTITPMPAAKADSSASAPPTAGSTVGQASIKKCPANFMIDGLPIDGTGTADVDARPETIEAIEVYSGAMVPIEYSARNSECGVVMIWTRLFAGRS
jgi:hypothetical protein